MKLKEELSEEEQKKIAEDCVLHAAKEWYHTANGPTNISHMDKANKKLWGAVKNWFSVLNAKRKGRNDENIE
jgi:hypothetical protein